MNRSRLKISSAPFLNFLIQSDYLSPLFGLILGLGLSSVYFGHVSEDIRDSGSAGNHHFGDSVF
jgi:hypothetical protein